MGYDNNDGYAKVKISVAGEHGSMVKRREVGGIPTTYPLPITTTILLTSMYMYMYTTTTTTVYRGSRYIAS